MRILTVLESPSWCEHHIAGSLEQMGHTVHRFSYGDCVGEFYGRAGEAERVQKNRQLFDLAKSLLHGKGLDLIFCYVYDDFLLPETARSLAGLGVPMVNFNVDMVNQWYRQIRSAKYFARILCAQRANMQNMARHDAKVMYFPMAARLPGPEAPEVSAWKPAAPVTFVGTPTPYRTGVLARLQEVGVPIAVYGKFWLENRQATSDRNWEKTLSDLRHYGLARLRGEGPGSLLHALVDRLPGRPLGRMEQAATLHGGLIHGFVPDGAMAAMFRNSKINLGFTRMIGMDPDMPGVSQVKLRDFEVPIAGGFYLVEKAPDYDSLFRPGVEVETWSGVGELLEKIRYYLEHDSEREAIARAGAARAQAEHSWQTRFSRLFNELGLAG